MFSFVCTKERARARAREGNAMSADVDQVDSGRLAQKRGFSRAFVSARQLGRAFIALHISFTTFFCPFVSSAFSILIAGGMSLPVTFFFFSSLNECDETFQDLHAIADRCVLCFCPRVYVHSQLQPRDVLQKFTIAKRGAKAKRMKNAARPPWQHSPILLPHYGYVCVLSAVHLRIARLISCNFSRRQKSEPYFDGGRCVQPPIGWGMDKIRTQNLNAETKLCSHRHGLSSADSKSLFAVVFERRRPEQKVRQKSSRH